MIQVRPEMIYAESVTKKTWDLFVAITAVALGIFTPLYVVFAGDFTMVPVFAVFTFGVFVLDIFVEFLTVHSQSGMYRTEFSMRCTRYLRTGLVTDVIAAFPGLLLFSTGVLSGFVPQLVLVLPLLKYLKVNRTLRRVGEGLMNPAVFRLFLLVFWILMAAHLIACGWILVSSNRDTLGRTDLYILAFYWTITTLTTIGYGDITPVGRAQVLFVIVIQLFGAAMYGLVIGNIAGLIANIDIAKSQYREKLDKINAFLKYRNIPDRLMRKINSYYGYLWETRKGYDELAFLEDLPVALKESVALHLNKEIIERVPLFEKADAALIRDIILQLQPVVFTPDDYIVRAGELGRDMYFISRGSVTVLSADESIVYATLSAGQFFGEISLLLSMPRTATIKAAEFCDLYRLDKDHFDLVVERYPLFKESIQEQAEQRNEEVAALRSERANETRRSGNEEKADPVESGLASGTASGLQPAPTVSVETIRARRTRRGVLLTWQGIPDSLGYQVAQWDARRQTWVAAAGVLARPAWTDTSARKEKLYRIRYVSREGFGPWSRKVRVLT